MKKVLIFSDWYLPGFKAGGPIVSISNIIDNIPTIEFKLLTRNHDSGNLEPYTNIKDGVWNNVGNAKAFYLSRKERSIKSLRNIINNANCDLFYFNSFFSVEFTFIPLLLRKMRLIPSKPIVLAPRGEFSPGALNLKKVRKIFYIFLFKLLNIDKGILWHATNKIEKDLITSSIGKDIKIQIASNLFKIKNIPFESKIIKKKTNSLNIIFLSRISRKKNLDFALKLLTSLTGNIRFDIFGPIEDKGYWKECKIIINSLPSNIKINYRGVYNKEFDTQVFKESHVFLFPTKGENFGHVIIESLSEGCPVIISDQTPWRNLSKKKIGWDIPLTNIEKFIEVLNLFLQMDETEFNQYSNNAITFVNDLYSDEETLQNNIKLFTLTKLNI